MKVFEYTYYIPYEYGTGIVIADSKEEAVEMMLEPYSEKDYNKLFPQLEFTEIDVNRKEVIDHSWSE